MIKRSFLFAAFILSACGAAETSAPTKAADSFLTNVQADYPVTLSKIAEGVWVHTTNYTLPGQSPIPVNGLVVVDGEDVILIDGAWGELATLSLLEKIKKETGKAVTKMIVTHHHMDRTAGVDVAEWQGIQIFTHPDTPSLAAESGFPVPNTSVAALKNSGARTKVGSVELAYPGHGHSSDNLIAYIPSAEILYGGCAVRGAGSKTLGNQVHADLEKWAISLNWMKTTYPKAKIVVPGHGKGANLSLIDATLALITESGAKDEAP